MEDSSALAVSNEAGKAVLTGEPSSPVKNSSSHPREFDPVELVEENVHMSQDVVAPPEDPLTGELYILLDVYYSNFLLLVR